MCHKGLMKYVVVLRGHSYIRAAFKPQRCFLGFNEYFGLQIQISVWSLAITKMFFSFLKFYFVAFGHNNNDGLRLQIRSLILYEFHGKCCKINICE